MPRDKILFQDAVPPTTDSVHSVKAVLFVRTSSYSLVLKDCSNGKISDLTESRLIVDATDDEESHYLDEEKFGHGHNAISVMSSTPNNGKFVAGINWNSDVYVVDVYDPGVDLQSGIEKALDYANDEKMKVVFERAAFCFFWCLF